MAQDGWYFKYGDYKHAGCECWFQEERRAVLSPERRPMYIACAWHIHGFLQADASAADGPANLKQKELLMSRAYSIDGKDAGWYLSTGVPTVHQIKNKDTLRGVRVTRQPYFPSSRGAEGVRWRNYSIGIEWEEEPESSNADDLLLEHEETFEIIGNAGYDWAMIAPVVGRPQLMPKTEGSIVTITQTGRSVGRNWYPPAASPLWSTQPPLHGPSVRLTARKIPGPELKKETLWSYTFYFAAPQTFGASVLYDDPFKP